MHALGTLCKVIKMGKIMQKEKEKKQVILKSFGHKERRGKEVKKSGK